LIHLPYYALRYRALQRLTRNCREKRAVVLTFDDGPGRQLTPELAKLLAKHEAKGTFFMLGSRIEGNHAVVDDLAAAGHELGVHSFAHCHAWKVGWQSAARDVAEGYAAASKWVASDGLFRPPYGKLSYGSWRELRRRQAPICWWTADSGDTWLEPPPIEHACEQVIRDGGGVVLFHDFDRDSKDSAYQGREQFVMDAVQHLLHTVRARGMRSLVMSEVV